MILEIQDESIVRVDPMNYAETFNATTPAAGGGQGGGTCIGNCSSSCTSSK